MMTQLSNIARTALSASLSATVLALGLSGCVMADESPDGLPYGQTAGSTAGATAGSTAGSTAGQIQGVVSMNGLDKNALGQNLPTDQGLQNNAALETLASDPSGRDLLAYVAVCVLDQNDELTFTVDGTQHVFPGSLGIAPTWKTGALGADRYQAVSACLIAHVNDLDVEVPISVRSAELTVSAEDAMYPFFEGAFFGNTLAGSSEMYTCSGDALDLETAGWRTLRVCTDVESGDTTYCGYTYVGACSDVCTPGANGAYESCQANGNSFSTPMSVHLID